MCELSFWEEKSEYNLNWIKLISPKTEPVTLTCDIKKQKEKTTEQKNPQNDQVISTISSDH